MGRLWSSFIAWLSDQLWVTWLAAVCLFSGLSLITDGLPAYRTAYMKEWWTAKKATHTEHIRHVHFNGDMNNNKMERINGEIRDREKTMRGLKKENTPILKGYQLYHDFVRPHEGLKGKTPADMVGIKVEGQNKWMTIIQNAKRAPTVDGKGDAP